MIVHNLLALYTTKKLATFEIQKVADFECSETGIRTRISTLREWRANPYTISPFALKAMQKYKLFFFLANFRRYFFAHSFCIRPIKHQNAIKMPIIIEFLKIKSLIFDITEKICKFGG